MHHHKIMPDHQADQCGIAHCTLPLDALRRVLSLLDWRALATCQAVCHSWHTLTADDQFWRQHVSSQFFRFSLLAYCAAVLPAGWKDLGAGTASAAAAARSVLALPAPSGAVPANTAATASSSSRFTPGVFKSIFSAGLLHAAASHQAHLSRFHTAVPQITGWRLVLKANTNTAEPATAATATAATAAAAATDADAAAATDATTSAGGGEHAAAAGIGQLSLRDPDSDAGPSSSTAAAAGGGLVPSPQGGALASAGSGRRSSSSSSRQPPVSGHPAALTLQALESGGWACGCILIQQQEQSCWLRFNLPPELKTDKQVALLVLAGQMSAVVQGLGPSGWFEVARADPFQLADEETEILMQSHKTGFYAWDQRGEEGEDRFGAIQPLPWDLNPGQHQADQLQPPQQDQQQQPQVSASASAAYQQAAQQQQQQQQQQGNQPQQQGGQEAAAPQLRMLVYVHYEQLLQVLPWALPHAVPLPAAPVLQTPTDFACHLLAGPCALWLQLDVCRLYGGHRLGTCVVPLVLWDWDSGKAGFRCVEDQLLVVLHKQDSSFGCGMDEGSPAAEEAAAGQGSAAAQQQQQQSQSVSAASRNPMQSAATAARATGSMINSMLDWDACQQVLLGGECLYGAGSSSSRDGAVVHTAADALRELMGTDEIMIDFALFDVTGHLLMGRAGVEVWSKERTDVGYIQEGVCQHATADTLAAAQQPQTVQPPADGAGSSGGDGHGQPGSQPPAAAESSRVESLAACIASNGPLQPRWRRPEVAEQHRMLWVLRECMRLSKQQVLEIKSVQEAQQALAAPSVPFTRTQHTLNFLVDGLPMHELFWHNCIIVDAERPSAGWVRLGDALGPISTVSLQLSWANLRALFGLPGHVQ